MIPAARVLHRISIKLRASFIHFHRAAVKGCSIQCRNSAVGFSLLSHFHEGDASGFARIPVLNDRNGFDTSVGDKKVPQLLLCHREIQVPDKDVSHEFILLLIFLKSRNQESTRNFQKAIFPQIAFCNELRAQSGCTF